MNENENFSGIPSLGDAAGLENFIQNENLKAMGGVANPAPAANPNPNPAQPAQPAVPGTDANPATPNPADIPNADAQPSVTITRAEYDAMQKQIAAINQQLNANRQQPAAQAPQVNIGAGYDARVKSFITEALNRGYSLEQIQKVLAQRNDPAVNQMNARMAAIEKQLQEQQYQDYEARFIGKMTSFGNKWGLSENDLVTFGQEALKQGINVANDNVNLEAVFRAIYPEQYAIRSQRMANASKSQIFGGAGIPDNPQATNSKLADAYVEAFIKSHYPQR